MDYKIRYMRNTLYRVNQRYTKAVHLLFPQFMDDDDPAERELAIFMDVVLLGKCSELWVLGETVSAGMQAEIDVAKKRRQPIRWFNSEFQEVELL